MFDSEAIAAQAENLWQEVINRFKRSNYSPRVLSLLEEATPQIQGSVFIINFQHPYLAKEIQEGGTLDLIRKLLSSHFSEVQVSLLESPAKSPAEFPSEISPETDGISPLPAEVSPAVPLLSGFQLPDLPSLFPAPQHIKDQDSLAAKPIGGETTGAPNVDLGLLSDLAAVAAASSDDERRRRIYSVLEKLGEIHAEASASPSSGIRPAGSAEASQESNQNPLRKTEHPLLSEGRGESRANLAAPPVGHHQQAPSSTLNPLYTFENFVAGSSNDLAYACAQQVSERPAENYNPLFIYGKSGLGKTHILQAIGNYAQKLFPHMQVKYVSSEDFTNHFINSISTGKVQDFNQSYRQVDLLLIDDIQFIQKKEQTQEAFFHIFNSLHNSNRQIVITSDKEPKDLPDFTDRMLSRFSWGLCCDIQTPSFETRTAILDLKCRMKGLKVDPEVLSFIAQSVSSNVRELEGRLSLLLATASMEKKEITLELAQQVLDELSKHNRRRIDPLQIIELTAQHFKLAPEDLCGTGRSARVSIPRQVAMYLCRELTDVSLPQLGQIFSRDHSTVVYATNRISEISKKDPKIMDSVNQLTKYLLHES